VKDEVLRFSGFVVQALRDLGVIEPVGHKVGDDNKRATGPVGSRQPGPQR
jgi:hypothetical protein